MKTRIVEVVILTFGFLVMGLLLKAGFDNFSYKDRCVSVKGLAEIEVPADKVTCPFLFKEMGNDLQHVYANVNAKNRVIISFLTKNGIPESDIFTTSPSIEDLAADRYVNNQSPYRYHATAGVIVSSSQVETVKNLLSRQGELITKDIVIESGYSYRISYEFTKLNEVKPQMIEDATKNARAAAEKFAIDSNSKIGKIKRATQGQFTISDRDDNTPDIKRVRVVTTVEYFLED